jgi:excisionase family DNA binding protein
MKTPAQEDGAVTPITYRVEVAVQVSGVPRSTLYQSIRDGSLRSVKKGRSRLIFRDDLIAWLNTPDEPTR